MTAKKSLLPLFRKIDRFVLRYALLRAYVMFLLKRFFRVFHVTGRENIPVGKPLIITPNHQNALIDALSVLTLFSRPIFLARADIFKNRRVASILALLRIMPVYRMRDGRENLKDNESIFDRAVEVITKGIPLILFPEGQHTNKRSLLPLKKGASRIAFLAAERDRFESDIHLLPVGMNYSRYERFRSTLLINVGKPIRLADYREAWQHDQNQAIAKLNQEIALRLRPLMIDIPDGPYYDAIDFSRLLYRPLALKHLGYRRLSISQAFEADKATVAALCTKGDQEPGYFDALRREVDALKQLLEKHSLDYRHLRGLRGNLLINSILYLVLFPVYVYGVVNNAIPYLLPKLLLRRIKDKQFHSSIHFASGILVTFPLFYAGQLLAVGFATHSWWFAAAYLFSLPFTGVAAFHYYWGLKRTVARFRLWNLRRKKLSVYHDIMNAYARLTTHIKDAFAKVNNP